MKLCAYDIQNIKNTVNFKGYDAAPLRRITTSDTFGGAFLEELVKIAEKENITILSTPFGPQWYQDTEVVLKGDKKPRLVMTRKEGEVSKYHYRERREDGIYPISLSEYYIKGGDVFLGKYPNGEMWMLTGNKEFLDKNRENIAKTYNIKSENIHSIPNKNYHLDTYIRPIGYPYILVDDEKMVMSALNTLQDKKKDARDFRANVIKYEKERKEAGYKSTDEVCEKLEELGFIPIRVPGVWGSSINFMNAIVNLHPDGTISYITGSSKCKNKTITKVQDIFEQELRRKIPNLKDIYFIEGKQDKKDKGFGNKIMQTLSKYKGGLHCMTLEEPDFDIWG